MNPLFGGSAIGGFTVYVINSQILLHHTPDFGGPPLGETLGATVVVITKLGVGCITEAATVFVPTKTVVVG